MVNMGGIVLLCFGIYFLVVSKWSAKMAHSHHKKLWGIIRKERNYLIAFMLTAIIFMVAGIQDLFGVVRFH